MPRSPKSSAPASEPAPSAGKADKGSKPGPARRRESGVRTRTRALLLDAAVKVFARKGAGAAAIHEITEEAGVSNGTFYNYFQTREELLEAAGLSLAERFTGRITASYAAVSDPAQRLAIGCRRFLLQAQLDPTWAAALLRLWASSPVLHQASSGLLADLRAGLGSGRLVYISEVAAVDLVGGAVLGGMRTLVEGRAGDEHGRALVGLLLRAFGLDGVEADDIAARPLPPLPEAGSPGSR